MNRFVNRLFCSRIRFKWDFSYSCFRGVVQASFLRCIGGYEGRLSLGRSVLSAPRTARPRLAAPPCAPTRPARDMSGIFPGHALHEKGLQRQKGGVPLVGSQEQRVLLVLRTCRIQNPDTPSGGIGRRAGGGGAAGGRAATAKLRVQHPLNYSRTCLA